MCAGDFYWNNLSFILFLKFLLKCICLTYLVLTKALYLRELHPFSKREVNHDQSSYSSIFTNRWDTINTHLDSSLKDIFKDSPKLTLCLPIQRQLNHPHFSIRNLFIKKKKKISQVIIFQHLLEITFWQLQDWERIKSADHCLLNNLENWYQVLKKLAFCS